jgi:hypothetical protein
VFVLTFYTIYFTFMHVPPIWQHRHYNINWSKKNLSISNHSFFEFSLSTTHIEKKKQKKNEKFSIRFIDFNSN